GQSNEFNSPNSNFVAFVTRDKDIAKNRQEIDEDGQIEAFVAAHAVDGRIVWGVFRDFAALRARSKRRMPVVVGLFLLAISSSIFAFSLGQRYARTEVAYTEAEAKVTASLNNLRQELRTENAKLNVTSKGALENGPDRALVGLAEIAKRASADATIQVIEIRSGKARIVGHSPNPEATK
ncbi:MAG: hypothetical protein AAB680_00410, partial [Pseudomonadota bacterium]